MPFGPLDAVVVVGVEIFEAVFAVEIDVLRQKLCTRQNVVAIPIRANERLEVIAPLVTADPPVAVAVEVLETFYGPVIEVATSAIASPGRSAPGRTSSPDNTPSLFQSC